MATKRIVLKSVGRWRGLDRRNQPLDGYEVPDDQQTATALTLDWIGEVGTPDLVPDQVPDQTTDQTTDQVPAAEEPADAVDLDADDQPAEEPADADQPAPASAEEPDGKEPAASPGPADQDGNADGGSADAPPARSTAKRKTRGGRGSRSAG